MFAFKRNADDYDSDDEPLAKKACYTGKIGNNNAQTDSSSEDESSSSFKNVQTKKVRLNFWSVTTNFS